MAIYERTTLLKATCAEAYFFHEDPKNISKISPPSLRVEEVLCSVPACVGEEFRLRVRQFGVPLEWVGVWEEAVPHVRLVDGARKSPFRHWRHQHLFQPEGEWCMMTDRVTYELPYGVLGCLLDKTLMKLIFTVMFLSRHNATKAYFEGLRRK